MPCHPIPSFRHESCCPGYSPIAKASKPSPAHPHQQGVLYWATFRIPIVTSWVSSRDEGSTQQGSVLGSAGTKSSKTMGFSNSRRKLHTNSFYQYSLLSPTPHTLLLASSYHSLSPSSQTLLSQHLQYGSSLMSGHHTGAHCVITKRLITVTTFLLICNGSTNRHKTSVLHACTSWHVHHGILHAQIFRDTQGMAVDFFGGSPGEGSCISCDLFMWSW